MTTTLRMLAELVNGELFGDGDFPVLAARPLPEAGVNDISFMDSDKYANEAAASGAGAVVVRSEASVVGKHLIRVADPLMSFVKIFRQLMRLDEFVETGIDRRANVHPGTKVGPDASIDACATIEAGCTIGARCRLYPGVVVGKNCRLGDDVTLFPNVVLYERTTLGSRVSIHANTVIGADGFGYRFQNGKHEKIPQLGWVEIGDDVEIGAGTTIDRGTFTATRIGSGTKIDNLVMIAHNCQIGRHNILVSQMGMAGSSSTGDYVVIAGQAGVVDRVHIGDGSTIGGRAGVTKDVPPNSRMLGSPATSEHDQKRIMMSLFHLPEFRKSLRAVQERLGMTG